MSKASKQSEGNTRLKIIAIITFIIMVICNALANIIPIGGNNTGKVSDSYPNLFAPAGFTFSIWSLIYALLAAFCFYQFRRFRNKKSKVEEQTIDSVLSYFIASSLLNTAWIFAWQYRHIGISTILIILILICLARIVTLLRNYKFYGKDYLFFRLPFSIYFGWLSVAVIANITTWLVSIGWNGLGYSEVFWTIAVLTLGGLVGIINSERNNDIAYLLVFVWAYFGILAKHLSSTEFNGKYSQIITVLTIILGAFVYKLHSLYISRHF